jgi:hypothetical protein
MKTLLRDEARPLKGRPRLTFIYTNGNRNIWEVVSPLLVKSLKPGVFGHLIVSIKKLLSIVH